MSDLNAEEIAKLVEAFNKLKVKPKADTPEDLENWLKAFGKETEIKKEPEPTESIEKTKSTISSVHQPRISLFYGDSSKGEASYAQWVYEIRCLTLEKVHRPEVIAQAIRNSLRGEASNLLRRLGYGASISDILEKFDSVYGEVDSKEHLLAKFYSSKQEDHEDVTKWSCRLENILSSAVDRKLVEPGQVNDMLRNMFFQGLRPSLKSMCAYKFEQIKDFDHLRVAIRKIEQDHLKPDEQVTHCIASTNQSHSDDKKELKEMKSMIQSLTDTVQKLESKVNSQTSNSTNTRGRGKSKQHFNNRQNAPQDRSYNRNYDQGQRYQDSNREPSNTRHNQHYGSQNNQQSYRSRSQGQRYNNTYQGQTQQSTNSFQHNFNRQNEQHPSQTDGENEDNLNRGPLCFRCRQYGHYQWECGVRMDHSRKYLN